MGYTLVGLDVSRHQGNIDWKKAAAGQDFVIIRAGYGRFASQQDPCFQKNIEGAVSAGLAVGVYWYSYAASEAEAKEEAETCLSVIKPYRGKITLPVFFDQEYEPSIIAASKSVRTACCAAFCRAVQAAGFRPGMYGSLDWLQNKITLSQLPKSTVIWCARYSDKTPPVKHTVWQYSSTGKIPGISGRVDLDRAEASLLGENKRWEKAEKGWIYGGYQNRWAKIDGYWYWFNAEGFAVTGWVKVDGKWYYFLTLADAQKTGFKECACMEISS